ncbi:hypothetical protein RB195_012806 [Necator americanus]|uniref:Uncharacterized protein n=1 Tax=Necator americanus TaxID=51031 RepID=A0ABR1DSL9_NECAM
MEAWKAALGGTRFSLQDQSMGSARSFRVKRDQVSRKRSVPLVLERKPLWIAGEKKTQEKIQEENPGDDPGQDPEENPEENP